ncbi:tropomyosin-like [Actinia tenebrosa]|uniref:Tropomyosin-like n=1 Tax=Actinia tenebrosa TaxID=6105 RepID=A0A6P8IVZ2_ACTTE|nr:tropomyosin-like [Actinia tenebrosa]
MSGRPRDPNDDIEELQQKVRNNEIKIAELEQQLQRDRDCYTKKTNELEDEKKTLENEVDELKKKIKLLEDEQKGRDARFDSMDKKLEKMAKELQFFTKKSQDQEKKLNEYVAKTDKLEKSRNKLYIGQLCANVMEAIYWEVLPEYFDEEKDYKQPPPKY